MKRRKRMLLTQNRMACWIGTCLILAGVATAIGRTPGANDSSRFDRSSSQDSEEGDGKPKQRMREGEKLTDVMGTFKSAAGDIIFLVGEETEGQMKFEGLPNLNLQRIAKEVAPNPGLQWQVSGMVTEFNGANYLLIERAIKKARSTSSNGLAVSSDD